MIKNFSIFGLILLIVVMAGDEPPENAVMIEKNAHHQTLARHDVFSWQTWEKEPSKFVWQFAEKEKAYVLEGKVYIRAHGSDEVYLLEKGDFVTFAPGLRTYWHVVEPFKKHVTHEKNVVQRIYWKLAFKVQSTVRLFKEQVLT
jgi:uncharacterized protein